ncbi:aminopeptidase, partial [Candidatus Dependentiae bacterium]|nr:aminopeptidase [Candidatus Dependentiae bacterium]
MQKNNFISKLFLIILFFSILIFLSIKLEPYSLNISKNTSPKKTEKKHIITEWNPIYFFKLFHGEFKIIIGSKKIKDLQKKPDLNTERKEVYAFIFEVKKFATETLELKGKDTYSKLYDTKGAPVAYNLTVVPSLSINPVRWKYPIVGTFPYRGYFSKKDAIKDENKWKKKGYDTYLRSVAAFSTLGWFSDPIYSSMLKYNKGIIAEIIIHERVHNTIFLKNQMEFNESIANFFGKKGAELFLKKKFGTGNNELVIYQNIFHDQTILYDFIDEIHFKLKELYNSDLSNIEKKKIKKNIIKKQMQIYQTLPFKNKGYKTYLTEDKINNAFIVSHKTYSTDEQIFEETYRILNNDIVEFIKLLKKIPKKDNG